MTLIRDDYNFTELINGVIENTLCYIENKEYDINDTNYIASDLMDYDFRNGAYYGGTWLAVTDIYNNYFTIQWLIEEYREEGYTFSDFFTSADRLHLEILLRGVEERLACRDVQDFLEEHADEYNTIKFDSELLDKFKELFIKE